MSEAEAKPEFNGELEALRGEVADLRERLDAHLEIAEARTKEMLMLARFVWMLIQERDNTGRVLRALGGKMSERLPLGCQVNDTIARLEHDVELAEKLRADERPAVHPVGKSRPNPRKSTGGGGGRRR